MSHRILLALTNPTYIEYLVGEFSKKEYAVSILRSIDQLESIVDEHSYDVAIVDIDFQGPDRGWSIVRLLRTSPKWSRNLAIMVGSNGMPKIPNELRGSYDYLMMLPRYLITIMDDIEAALKAAQNRVESSH